MKPKSTTGAKLDAAKKFVAFAVSKEGCDTIIKTTTPGGPFVIKGCTLPDNVPPAVKDMQPYFDSGANSPALEFLSPVKGPALEQITVEVGSGIRKAADGAALSATLGELRRAEKDLVINYEYAEEIQKHKQAWQTARESALAQARALAGTQSDEGERIAAEIGKLIVAYTDAFTPVLRQLETGGYDSATVANRMAARAKESIQQAQDRMKALDAFLQTEAKAAAAEREAAVHRAKWVLGGALLLAIATLLPLTLFNTASICRCNSSGVAPARKGRRRSVPVAA